MMIFATNDLTNMRTAQTEHMQDFGRVLSYAAGTLNEFNEADAPTYTESVGTRCGLDMNPNTGRNRGGEYASQDMTRIQYDAVVRLPLDVVVKETDRFQVTHRFGEELDSALTYEIVSPIIRGPSGIRLVLKKVVV
ncbi:MAG: hypothetical protein LC114_17865 [Bryobacterales bacterium]|nr:hypothetical protein [Bryobacterales bacterium]